MAKLPDSVSEWDPKTPSGTIESMLDPNAKDNPDSLSPTNDQKPESGKKGTVGGDYGSRGKNF